MKMMRNERITISEVKRLIVKEFLESEVITINGIKLHNLFPKECYPIMGKIILTDEKTDELVLESKCYIDYSDNIWKNDIIRISDNFYTYYLHYASEKKESNGIVRININDNTIPKVFKYQLEATIENHPDINNIIITGKCEPPMSFVIKMNNGDYNDDFKIELYPVHYLVDGSWRYFDLIVQKEEDCEMLYEI